MSKLNINPEKEPVPASWVPQVITGGKEPPSAGESWLSRLEVGCIFVTTKTGEFRSGIYQKVFTGEFHSLLDCREDYDHQIYVHTERFCNLHPVYEILGYELPEEEKDNEQRDPV